MGSRARCEEGPPAGLEKGDGALAAEWPGSSFPSPGLRGCIEVPRPFFHLPANPWERTPRQIGDDPVSLGGGGDAPALPSWNSMLRSRVEKDEIGKQGREAHFFFFLKKTHR